MNTYYFPISAAALTFPLIAGLFALPYAVISYRRYGAVSVWRTLILFSFVFYLQCAYYIVILPLPDPASVAARTGPFCDLIPFTFVKSFIRESPFLLSQPGTWLPALKDGTVLEPCFNIILLMPFGVYLAYYFKKSWKKVILFSFLCSLFFELSQLTGLFWLYSRPYRLFSVDDLLLNTLGGLVGYFVYVKLLRFLPNREQIDQKSRERGQSVSFFRRVLALFLDSLLISWLQMLLSGVLDIPRIFAFGIALSVYTVGFALLIRGRTPGKVLVRLGMSRTGEGRLLPAVILRYLLRNVVLLGCSFFAEMTGRSDRWQVQVLWLALFLILILASLVDCVYSLGKNRLLWYERLTRTENISTVRRNENHV